MRSVEPMRTPRLKSKPLFNYMAARPYANAIFPKMTTRTLQAVKVRRVRYGYTGTPLSRAMHNVFSYSRKRKRLYKAWAVRARVEGRKDAVRRKGPDFAINEWRQRHVG